MTGIVCFPIVIFASQNLRKYLKNDHVISILRVGILDPAMNIIQEYLSKSTEYDHLSFCDIIRFHNP